MLRLLRTPRWLGLAALVLVLVATFLALGRWQWHQAHQGRGHHPAGDPAPVALATLLPPGTALTDQATGRLVTAEGRYDGALQLLVPDRRLAGRAGYWLVTPLVTESGRLPVVRGWVAVTTASALSVPAGAVTVIARLTPLEDVASGIGVLPPNQVERVSLADLAMRWPPGRPLYQAKAVLVAQRPAAAVPPALVPAPPPPRHVPLRLQNAAYAVQWCFFAGFTVFWFFRMLRAEVDPAGPTAQPTPDTVHV